MRTRLFAAIAAGLALNGAALAEGRYADWLDLFDDDCAYLLQPRENYDRQLPLATMRLESKGMLRDRIYGIENTLFHQPYYQRHVIGVCRPVKGLSLSLPGESPASASQSPAVVAAQSNYAVFRTRAGGLSEVFNVGRYLMQLVLINDQPRIRQMHVVFDSELVPNSLIYPV